jgi:hypothetical protein
MAYRDVHLLNPRRRIGWNAQTKVARRSHFAPGFTRQAYNADLALTSRLNRAQNIQAVTAGGDHQQHIARPRMGSKFASKYVLVSIIVGNRRETRRVGVQSEGPEGAPLEQEPARKLCSNVLRIGC